MNSSNDTVITADKVNGTWFTPDLVQSVLGHFADSGEYTIELLQHFKCIHSEYGLVELQFNVQPSMCDATTGLMDDGAIVAISDNTDYFAIITAVPSQEHAMLKTVSINISATIHSRPALGQLVQMDAKCLRYEHGGKTMDSMIEFHEVLPNGEKGKLYAAVRQSRFNLDSKL
ncbi:hypothetical protein GQ42DRAFT_161559 [Ramicandelaber brevisporus]|nr:hypothetical protein GQ42DRAFT_161559 [Ramicandelaber brevisporus]